MMLRLASIVAAVAGLVGPSALQPARAQLPLALESAPEFVREALDHPYGRALIAEFTNAVIESADAGCLSQKRLDTAALDERGRDLFQRYGTRTMSMLQQNIDLRRYDAELAKRAGAKGKAELATLRKNPSVQAYTKTELPVRLAKVLDFVVEQFDRYVLLNRIQLKPISPLATGNIQLLAVNPGEASEEAPAGRPKSNAPQSKAGQPKAGQPKAGQPKAGEPKAGQPKAGQPKAAQPSPVQTKAGQPKAGQANPVQAKAGQPKAVQGKAVQAKARPTPRQVQRYVALSEASGVAILSAFNRETAALWGPKTFYSGVEDDLAEVCIFPRSNTELKDTK